MLKILFLFNAVAPSERQGAYSDCLSWDVVHLIYRALLESGHKILALNLYSPPQLEKYLTTVPSPHFAFVLAEGFLGEPRTLYDGTGAAAIRALLQHYGIPASHSPAPVMEICRHKNLTYEFLASHNLPVPRYMLVEFSQDDWEEKLKEAVERIGFPLFVKPNGGGNSLGIDEYSLSFNYQDLKRKVISLKEALGEVPVLVEEYLPGQEVTVGVIGQNPCYVLPPLAFLNKEIRTTSVKKGSSRYSPILAGEGLYRYLGDLAGRVFSFLGARDALRLDLRADSQGNFYVIDVNGTPSLNPTSSLMAMGASIGLKFPQLINFLLYQALLNYSLPPGARLEEMVAQVLKQLYPYRWEEERVLAGAC